MSDPSDKFNVLKLSGTPSMADVSEPARASVQHVFSPIDIILHCPECGEQHIDMPSPDEGWDNPPHRSHLCAKCGCIWRPADVPTNGVQVITTRGEKDTWPVVDDLPRKPRVFTHCNDCGAVLRPDDTMGLCERCVVIDIPNGNT